MGNKKIRLFLTGIAFFTALLVFGFMTKGSIPICAADPSTVTIGDIDYDNLTMKVYKNGNSIVYFSADQRKTWNEVEGETENDDVKGAYIIMDISWVNSKSEVTVFFKGDKETTALEAKFPKVQSTFKVKFDKAAIDFEFEGGEDSTSFMWRKSSDFNWTTVPFDKKSAGYKDFLTTVNSLRFKGCKLVFVCVQVVGTDASHMGQRPSKEVSVSIPKIANAPNVTVNVKKMILNTKTTQEYYDASKQKWVPCTKNMTIAELAPSALYASSKEGTAATVKIRIAATDKRSYSKTTVVVIPGQTKAPDISSGGHMSAAFVDGKLNLTFAKASNAEPLEYCIVKSGDTFDPSTAKWKTIKKAGKVVKINDKTCPDGSTIYLRFAGVNANASKNISLKLASYYSSYTVTWPKTDTSSGSGSKTK